MITNLKIAMVQHACTADNDNNLLSVLDGINQAAQKGADIVLLQELHNGLYFCQTEDDTNFQQAVSIPGPLTQKLAAAAKQNGVIVVASLFEQRAPGLYHNTAVVFEKNGDIAGIYRKMHIPDDPGYYEKYYFAPGDLGFNPIRTSVGNLGVLICWDQWFPEAARLMALAGADMLLYPTAIGWNPDDNSVEQGKQLQSWITIQRAHAIANGIPVFACNRIGYEADQSGQTTGINFWGSSVGIGQSGELLVTGSTSEPAVIVTKINLDDTKRQRHTWPFLRDRRIDAYDGILQRFRD